MLVWRYTFLLVLFLFMLSILATSMFLSTQKGCFDIGFGPEGVSIHYNSHCCTPDDKPRRVPNV